MPSLICSIHTGGHVGCWLSTVNGFRLCPGSSLGAISVLNSECICTEDLSCCLCGTKLYKNSEFRGQVQDQLLLDLGAVWRPLQISFSNLSLTLPCSPPRANALTFFLPVLTVCLCFSLPRRSASFPKTAMGKGKVELWAPVSRCFLLEGPIWCLRSFMHRGGHPCWEEPWDKGELRGCP